MRDKKKDEFVDFAWLSGLAIGGLLAVTAFVACEALVVYLILVHLIGFKSTYLQAVGMVLLANLIKVKIKTPVAVIGSTPKTEEM